MSEEEIKTNESGEVVQDNTDYITAIKELKEKSVSKTEYEKLKEENKKLLNSLVNGETISTGKEEPEETLDDLRTKTFSTKGRNIDIVDSMLKLRNRLIEEGEADPFLPNGHEYNPEYQDQLDAQNVADMLQTCLDIADGDADIFDTEFQRRITATPSVKKKGK